MRHLGKYFEKKSGIIWAVVTVILFLFAFGGFDLIFKLIYVKMDFQNSSLKWFQGIVSEDLNFSKFCSSNLFLLVLAFTTIVVVGLLIWIFTVAKLRKTKRMVTLMNYEKLERASLLLIRFVCVNLNLSCKALSLISFFLTKKLLVARIR